MQVTGESLIDLPVGQIKQPVRQQIVGWVERLAKPIAIDPEETSRWAMAHLSPVQSKC